jgi:predicted lipoprotein with Yx(FWY)xxD motif
MRRSSLLAAPVAVALLAAGCGSDNNNNSNGSGGSGGSGNANVSSPSASSNPATPPATAGGASVSVRKGPLGTYLTDAKGNTLYLFASDTASKSTCNGGCAQAWPPLTTKGSPKAATGAKASLLATIKRSDGTQQVTYGGHPLYTFTSDTAPGQTTGQGVDAFGALWWVVDPEGKLINKT